MKKLVTLILVLALIGTSLFSLAACGEEEEDLSAKIEEKLIAYRTDLEDSAGTLTSVQAIKDYLCNWAKSKGISYTTDGHNNVIMSVKASKEYKEADPTVIICPFDSKQFSNCIQPMAMALYLIKNNESAGKLDVIFTSETGHDFSGIQSISSKYFNDDANVFCLSQGGRNMWSLNTGGRSVYRFTNNLNYTAPTKDKAYRITIKGLPGGIPDSRISSYPNPIKEIGSLLAYFKTNALIYELAEVTGGGSAGLYPKTASATVIIDEDDFDKFQSRMETAIDNFNDDHLEDYPDVTYTFEEVPLPDQVMTSDSLNKTIGSLYTLINGVYYRDNDDNVVSLTNIGSIKCTDTTCTISAIGGSTSETGLIEIDNAYKTICSLSDINYRKIGTVDSWHSEAESDFAQEIADAFHSYSGKDIEYKDNVAVSSATFIKEINEKCNIISVSVNEDRIERYTGTILTFMLNQTHTEDS